MSGQSGETRFHYVLLFIVLLLAIAVAVLSVLIVIQRNDDDCPDSSSDNDRSNESPTDAPMAETVFAEAKLGQFRFAGVADDTGVCGSIGTDILARQGGSVVEAAIAVILCTGVVHPHSCGIGGGHFMTIYAAPRGETEKEMLTVLARETAPGGATEHMYIPANASSLLGGLAVGVPGEVRGYYEEWQRYGRLPWANLVAPSIDLCRNGYPVTAYLAGVMRAQEQHIRAYDGLREIFVKEDGTLYEEGEIMYDQKLADTLEIIANDPMAFYDPNSQLAQDIVADIQEAGGIITTDDLANYTPYIKESLNITLQNGAYTVFAPVPPSGGAVIQHILSILDGYFMRGGSVETTDDKILTYHRIVEAFKFAYGKRSALGDAEFVDVQELVENMTSSEFSELRRLLITDSTTHNLSYYEPAFEQVEDTGTAHLSILGADGSAVAITSTTNYFFGSKVRGSRTGIIFNNEMDDFSTPGTVNVYGFPASPSNFIQPGKMPMSSMSPSIVLDSMGNVRFISGASGGSRIISATAFVMINSLWLDKRVDVATGLHRLHHQLVPDILCIEEGFDQEIVDGLRSKGHVVNVCGSSVVQSIQNTCTEEYPRDQQQHCVLAVSDGRKSGIPDGY